MALAICASVSAADPSKNVVTTSKHVPSRKIVKKICYTNISGSGIPQPCDRLGTIPTTAIPMTIIGKYAVEREVR